MIRTTAVPRPVRTGAAMLGVAGMLTLAGCATTPRADAESTADAGSGTDATTGGPYTDGTYTAEGSYATPESVEEISVTVTLEDDVITAVEVTGNPTKRESEQYQGQFIGGIEEVVVGQDIDDISVSRVAGSSLTSGGFNEAIEAIKAEAAA
ncbi:FMN-binding protein [Microbacterium sp. RU33B]|uniref:FMN-binding protein n=1 Tax=Microbacterium sp. RU33B TaxID=1907390 RepID=UPI00095E94AF|nr:FMN-binding protein [Microbacterium sp. RU33B]SIT70998.1 FMN-binding domain-containing protein [Microbacterium sp. RU33B]